MPIPFPTLLTMVGTKHLPLRNQKIDLALKHAWPSSSWYSGFWLKQLWKLRDNHPLGPEACMASVKNHSITSLSESRWRAGSGLWQVWGHSGQSSFQPRVEQFWNLGSCREKDGEPERLSLPLFLLSFSLHTASEGKLGWKWRSLYRSFCLVISFPAS